jgi:predicted Zn-dependent protease
VTGASITGVVSGYDVDKVTSAFNDTIGEIVGTLVNNGYSQSQEFNADSTALSLLASAGYNPSGLVDMLKELDKEQKNDSGGFSKTHPSPASRLASVERILDKQPEVTDTGSSRRARFTANTK